jgi:hypothetical protein
LEILDQDQFTESIHDVEFSGGLAQAAGQGAKFALMLAMLEQDVLNRPYFEPQQAPVNPYQSVQIPVSDYPQVALSAAEHHWSSAALTGELIGNAYLVSARLWQTMHPSPLSIFNDATRIDPQVINNCDLPAQRRLQQETATKPMAVDETKLYDILNELQGAA